MSACWKLFGSIGLERCLDEVHSSIADAWWVDGKTIGFM
jgi:hypothetical protein